RVDVVRVLRVWRRSRCRRRGLYAVGQFFEIVIRERRIKNDVEILEVTDGFTRALIDASGWHELSVLLAIGGEYSLVDHITEIRVCSERLEFRQEAALLIDVEGDLEPVFVRVTHDI